MFAIFSFLHFTIGLSYSHRESFRNYSDKKCNRSYTPCYDDLIGLIVIILIFQISNALMLFAEKWSYTLPILKEKSKLLPIILYSLSFLMWFISDVVWLGGTVDALKNLNILDKISS